MVFVFVCLSADAKRVRLFGYILDEDNRGIELANAYVEGTTIGTTTNRNGYYDMQVDLTDSITLVYSMLGYETIRQRIMTTRDVLQINVVLPAGAEALGEVEVKAVHRQTGQMDQIDVSQTRLMPDASGGSIESILITFAGVTQNNELSSQYNARGGNFDENEVYVNGIEVYRPLLIRAGQQEGLSFVNTDMVESVEFAAGGFDAMYGDKMSSVLDIKYKRPDKFEANLTASILGASAYIGTGDSTYSMMHGIRYKTSRYMLGALPTKGNYQPNFIDYQTYITWKLDRHRIRDGLDPRWEMSFMGNFSQNSYRFRPEESSESFGGLSSTRKLTIGFEGQEKDMFRTAFGALSIQGKINREVGIGFDISGFYTNEQENYDITNDYFMTDDPETNLTGASGQQTNGTSSGTLNSDSITGNVLGKGMFHEHSRNRLEAGVITLAHNGSWLREQNKMQWGVSVQAELINDNIQEWQWRDSMGYSIPTASDDMALYYSLRGSQQMQSMRLQGYVQDTYKWLTEAGSVLLTGGLRAQWWSLNKEFLLSPRASLTWLPGWKRDFSFRFATGLYYQAPFYKELRRMVTGDDGVTRIELNHNLKAQRSVHLILGGDYYFRAWGRPFRLTAEAYYKYMDRVVNYTVENVRIRYSGDNDGVAYTTGLDLKLYGELVPGAESWISLSAMRSRQRLITDDGWSDWLIGMNEQRFAFSMLFQDYIPRLPQCKVHLKTIVSDGLPFAYPTNATARGHLKTYFRMDIGASWEFTAKTYSWMRNAKHIKRWALQFEVFNLTDYKNVNSYFWVTDAHNMLWGCPNYLTGRMYNGKIIIDFQ